MTRIFGHDFLLNTDAGVLRSQLSMTLYQDGCLSLAIHPWPVRDSQWAHDEQAQLIATVWPVSLGGLLCSGSYCPNKCHHNGWRRSKQICRYTAETTEFVPLEPLYEGQ